MDERRNRKRPGTSGAQKGRPGSQRPVQRPDQDRRAQRRQYEQAQKRRRLMQRRKKRRKRMLLILILLLVIIAIGAVFGWKRYGPSKTKADLNGYFGITGKNKAAVVVNNEIPDINGIKENGRIYLDYESVRDYINDRFYWDRAQNSLLYTLPDRTLRISAGAKEYESEEGTVKKEYEIVKLTGETAYIALDFVKEYTDMTLDVYENPDRVVIVTNKTEKHAKVKKDAEVRVLGGIKSPILTQVHKSDDVVIVEKAAGDWQKVRTKEGFIGYMKANRLEDAKEETRTSEFKEPEYTSIHKDYKISLGWHQVTNQAANENVDSVVKNTKGLTTLSPTWFSVKDTNGTISSLASSDYVDYAHQQGMEVWGLIDNFTYKVDTLAVLSNSQSRANIISQLMKEAEQSGLDGINVDFEQITEEMSEHYIQFIRELSVECRKRGLVLSVDNYVPKGYTAHYNRKEQGVVADYVIIMGYDEHYAGSEEAGSVSSIGFVEEGIKETLKEVPKEKVINGLPFFTRLWIESPDGGLTSQAIGMQDAEKAVEKAGVSPIWNEETQQNYAEWTKEGNTYKIWLEDEKSLKAKLKVMKEHDLAGVAAWKLGFEEPEVWDEIQTYLKN